MPRRYLVLLALLLPFGLQAQGPAKGKRYALLVGIKEYQHQNLPALRYSEDDVVELAKVLREHEYNVTLMCDTSGATDQTLRPTRENIEKSFKRILSQCQKADGVLVAFSGHGLQFENDENAYFCPVDAKPFSDQKATLVALQMLYKEFDQSFARTKVLLVDASRTDPKLSRGAAIGTPRPPRGVGALFSCSPGEVSFEHEKFNQSVFFHYVLAGLRGEAKNKRGQVTFNNLADFVATEVPNAVSTMIGEGARQTPQQFGNFFGPSPILLEIR